MTAPHWTKEALIARTDAAFAPDHARLPVTPERARLRLAYFDIVAAGTRGETTSQQAILKFEEITRQAS